MVILLTWGNMHFFSYMNWHAGSRLVQWRCWHEWARRGKPFRIFFNTWTSWQTVFQVEFLWILFSFDRLWSGGAIPLTMGKIVRPEVIATCLCNPIFCAWQAHPDLASQERPIEAVGGESTKTNTNCWTKISFLIDSHQLPLHVGLQHVCSKV